VGRFGDYPRYWRTRWKRGENHMKTLVVSTLAFAAMTAIAFAGAPQASKAPTHPVKLTSAQMDKVSAGSEFNESINIGVGSFGAACGERCGARAGVFVN
jgi:hypothetical protein